MIHTPNFQIFTQPALPTPISIAHTVADGADRAVRHIYVTDCRGVRFEIARPKVSAGVHWLTDGMVFQVGASINSLVVVHRQGGSINSLVVVERQDV